MPDNNTTRWTRDILLIPIIVGIFIALFTYLLPKFFEKGKEISYTIEGPTSYVNQQAAGAVTITVNGVTTPSLFAYKVRLWNSGSSPIKDLPVRFSFNPGGSGFQVFNVVHDTKPTVEFGKIEENGSDQNSRRFVYELLNPDDEDTLTFLINTNAPLAINAKSEGLRVTNAAPKEQGSWFRVLQIAVLILSFLASAFTLGLKYVADKTKLWPFK
jgi:hypothetical protein